MTQFITGVRGTDDNKQIHIYEPGEPKPEWVWKPSDAENLMTQSERSEFRDVLAGVRYGRSVTEFKWAAGGRVIAAIVGEAAILIEYPSKRLLFGAMNDTSMHSLEVLPGNKLAIVTSGSSQNDGIWVYDISCKVPTQPIQKLSKLPSAHALVWDATESMLWAAGADRWPKTKEPVHGRLVGYKYDGEKDSVLCYSADRDYYMRESKQLADEYPDWKEGPHDLTRLPEERKLLIVTDLDVYEFDLNSKKFSYSVAETYLKGFVSSPDRANKNIPRSGLKSLSLTPSADEYVYTANDWQVDFTRQVRFFSRSEQKPGNPVYLPGFAYKARWFCETPGWPSAH